MAFDLSWNIWILKSTEITLKFQERTLLESKSRVNQWHISALPIDKRNHKPRPVGIQVAGDLLHKAE